MNRTKHNIKKIIAYTAMILLFSTACSSDDKNNSTDNSYVNPAIIVDYYTGIQVNATGKIMYNQEYKIWYILTTAEGTIDAQTAYIPIKIEKTFLQEGRSVSISGTAYKVITPISFPAGTECFAVDISNIR